MSIFSIATGALQAAYAQIQTTGHNISNAGTEGYSRQEVTLRTAAPLQTGAGFFGRGVEIEGVRRRYDAWAAAEVAQNVALNSADKARFSQMSEIDRLFANPETGAASAWADFDSAVADVVNRPADTNARAGLLARAATLADRIERTGSQLAEVARTTDERIAQSVDTLNDSLNRLARMNDLVASSGATGLPNDLLDERDRLIEKVNESMAATAYIDDDGAVNLFARGGQSLVTGNTAARFEMRPDPDRPDQRQVVMRSQGQQLPVDPALLGGGALSGLLKMRDEDLVAARAQMGAWAAGLADAYNTAQSLAVDGNGLAGKPLFQTTGRVMPIGGTNSGAVLSVAVQPGKGAELRPTDYELRNDGGTWTARRLVDGSTATVSPVVSGGATTALRFDGLEVKVEAGTPATGDRFVVNAATRFADTFKALARVPGDVAAGQALVPRTGTTNAGTMAVTGLEFDTALSSAGNSGNRLSLRFDSPTSFTVLAANGSVLTTGNAYEANAPIALAGVGRLTLTGTPAAGDTVALEWNTAPTNDNRGARQMLSVADRPVVGRMDGVAANASDAWASLLGDVGLRTQSAEAGALMSQKLLDSAKEVRTGASGVDLDEEAARLLQFQQAYQAAAKLIQTAQSMFDTLLQTVNR